MREALEHDAKEVDGRFRSALKGDLHDAPFDGRRLVVALDVVAAHHIQHDVGTPAVRRSLGRRDEVLLAIVDGHIGTEATARGALFCRAGGGDHARAPRLRDLDCRGADAGRAAVHQQRLAALQTATLEHVVPDGEGGFRKRRGFDEGQTFRHG